MSNLLAVHRLKSKVTEKGKIPLIIEDIPVDPLCVPYLVTSSTGVLWLEEPHPGNYVKAAVREVVPGQLFLELLRSVVEESLKRKWGSVQSYDLQGAQEAVEYLRFYDLVEIEILINPSKSEKKYPSWVKELKIPIRPSSWLPENCAVILPCDRSYVGMIGHLDNKRAIAVVHNASRGITVLGSEAVFHDLAK